MVSFTTVGLALLISVIGVGYSSYRIGLRTGAESVVQALVDQGVLELTEEEDDQ